MALIRIRGLAATLLVGALLASPALSRNDPAPRGLPQPPGLQRLDSRAGDSTTAYVWLGTYATSRPVRAMERYGARLTRLGYSVTTGPGANLTFRFRRWQVYACADSGCSAPKGRMTVVVAIPGG